MKNSKGKTMKRKIFLTLGFVLVLFFCCMGDDCDSPRSTTASSGAKQVEDMYQFPKNAQGHTSEQQNIYDRYAVTSDFTKVMWIHLISLDGKIIRRMPVSHKATSSGKRLEPTNRAYVEASEYTPERLQADGTYGTSDSYIYWFDPMHRYHQYGTAGGIGYLLTDYPIDLANPQDAMTGLYNLDQKAFEWQQRQEEELRKGKQ